MKLRRRLSKCFRSSIPFTAEAGKRLRRLRGWGLAAALALAVAAVLPAAAQFGPLVSRLRAPQAHSQEELDACLEIMTEADPRKTLAAVDRFVAKYPKSELLATVFEHQMFAFGRLQDLDGELKAGEKALQLQRNNVATLLTLATAIANQAGSRIDDAGLFQRGIDYAQTALREIATLHVPKEIPPARWELMKNELEGQAHEALGMIAAKQGQPETAVKEFEAAVQSGESAKGPTFYRLGVAYSAVGRKEPAVAAFRRAAELGPDNVREMAQKALRALGEAN